MSYRIKVKLCLIIHLTYDLQSTKAALTGGETRPSKSPKHKQTFHLWSFVLRVFNSSVKRFAHLKKDLNSNTCLSLDSRPGPEVLSREHSAPTTKGGRPAPLCLVIVIKGAVLKCQAHGTIPPALLVHHCVFLL